MKKFIVVFFILFVIVTGIGFYVYKEISGNISFNQPNINLRAFDLNKNKPSQTSMLKDDNTLVITENQLRELTESRMKYMFSDIDISLINNEIRLSGKGKKIINYSFEAIALPIAENNKLLLKINSLKILGLNNNSLKEEFENTLNDEIDKNINNHFSVSSASIINKQIIITGEKK
jgi:hypothetical protein